MRKNRSEKSKKKSKKILKKNKKGVQLIVKKKRDRVIANFTHSMIDWHKKLGHISYGKLRK